MMRSVPPSVCRLPDLQPGVSTWEMKDLIRLVHQLAEQVGLLHKEGRFHRGIAPAAVRVDEQLRPALDLPERLVVLGGDYWDPQLVPPELSRAGVLELPDSIRDAAVVLRDRQVSLEPQSIDVYQLGALLCQLAAKRGVREYLYDPQVKASVPRAVQAVIERALRRSQDDRMNDCNDLRSALLEAIAGIGPESSPVDRECRNAPVSAADRETALNDTGAIEARQEDDLPFSRLGQFRVIAKIGQGGMGDVFRAVDDTLGRDVALKVLPRELTRSPAFVKRFQAEAMAVAQISHPNIVPIYSIGQDQGRHYFVMQLVEGSSLQALLDEGHVFDLNTTLKIIRQCLDGLGAAHRRGLVHRDVKPGNVLFDLRTGVAMLVDFGLVRTLHGMSRMTESGVIMGTVDYIAPEQARGQDIDERADQYSLGVMAYELLARRLPFTADSPTAMIFQHAYEAPYPLWKAAPHVPRALVDIVMRMMDKDARQRYPDVEAALADLRSFETGKFVAREMATGWNSGRSFLAGAPADDEPGPELSRIVRWMNSRWWQK
jgi:tRNA A-37 threonylcarbamoyl transferase component Bud32